MSYGWIIYPSIWSKQIPATQAIKWFRYRVALIVAFNLRIGCKKMVEFFKSLLIKGYSRKFGLYPMYGLQI